MIRFLEDIVLDVRYAARQFVRQPAFWAVVAATLVLGITASTTMFAVVDNVLIRSLPYPEPERLVHLRTSNLRGEFHHLNERSETMDLAAYYPVPREVTLNVDGEAARLPAAGVTAGLFDVLGVQPMLGRPFSVAEMRPGGPGIHGADFWRTYGVVILSAGAWRSYFDSSPAAVGSTLSIEGVPHVVVGVMPASFDFPSRDVALWFPHNIDPADPTIWNGNVATMIGRLKDGFGIDAARREIRAVMPTFRELIPWGDSYPESYGTEFGVTPLAEQVVGDTRPMLLLLLASIGVVLLVLCVNVANLQLARGASRERELTTRAAVGAGRGRLVRQLLIENVLVAVVAGAVSVLVSVFALEMLVGFLPGDLPRIDQVRIDARVLSFALGVSILTGLVFGVVPAMRATRESGGPSLSGTRGQLSAARESRLSGTLAALELSFAVVLMISAVLLFRSFWNLASVDPGFEPDRLVAARISPPGFRDRDPEAKQRYADSLLERLAAMPETVSAGLASALPLDPGLHGNAVDVDGRTEDAGVSAWLGVSSGYFATMATPVLAGRAFTEQDRLGASRVAIVSESFADAHWGDDDPIGGRIAFRDQRQYGFEDWADRPWFTVVGVVGDTRFHSLSSAGTQMVYLPIGQYWTLESLRAVVRPERGAAPVMSGLRDAVASHDPRAPVSDVETYDARVAETIASPRSTAFLLTGFASIALFMAVIGVYGVLSYVMSRRIPEIGVRMTFGAGTRDILRLMLGMGARLTLVGIALGIPLALGATRLLSNMLFGVRAADPGTFVSVAIALSAVSLAAAYVPARRASRIDAMSALRRD